MPTVLTQRQSRVLRALLNGEGEPYTFALARQLGLTPNSVQSSLKCLVKKGLVKKGEIQPTSHSAPRQLYDIPSRIDALKALDTYDAKQKEKSES